MAETSSMPPDPIDLSIVEAAREPVRLTLDLDVDVCVIGAGLAGLMVALTAAQRGASVAVLEGRRVGWNASGNQLGTVMPGYALPLGDLIARIGFEDARELWSLSQQGVEFVRATARGMGGIALSDGALEVSNVDTGDQLISRLQMLGEDFGTEVEGWQIERVRDTLRTRRYFHGVHYPKAFQVDGRAYLRGLAAMVHAAGARIYQDTPVVGIDAGGVRKRIVTPQARLRASHVVLAGNVYLGEASRRLSETLLPVWRYAGITAPLGDSLAEVINFQGSVFDTDGIDQFRVVDGNRLMWASPETTWPARPERFAGAIRRRIRTIFPALGKVEIAGTFAGATGQTVHGMPQIGQLRPGLWVASGFGRQGMNTSAAAAEVITSGMMSRDDRWRLFAPFELVWAGGNTGRVAGQAIGLATRAGSAAAGTLARYRERALVRETAREVRLAAANRQARMPPRPMPDNAPSPDRPGETANTPSS